MRFNLQFLYLLNIRAFFDFNLSRIQNQPKLKCSRKI